MSVAELQQGQGDLNDVPKLSVEGGLLCARASFPLKDLVRALPGRLWKPAPLRAWTWPATPAYAARLVEQLAPYGVSVDAGVETLLATRGRVGERATVREVEDANLPDLDWSRVVRHQPWPHQVRAILWAAAQLDISWPPPKGTGSK